MLQALHFVLKENTFVLLRNKVFHLLHTCNKASKNLCQELARFRSHVHTTEDCKNCLGFFGRKGGRQGRRGLPGGEGFFFGKGSSLKKICLAFFCNVRFLPLSPPPPLFVTFVSDSVEVVQLKMG